MSRQESFFKALFGDCRGFLCLALKRQDEFTERFFFYPDDLERAVKWLSKFILSHDIYFCPQLFVTKSRRKNKAIETPVAWADLDTAKPEEIAPAPSIVISTSKGRYQAYWLLKGKVPPLIAEGISKGIARYYAGVGVDQGGWDLTQLLRVPNTYNFKRQKKEEVKLISITNVSYTARDFDDLLAINQDKTTGATVAVRLPESAANMTMLEVLERYRGRLSPGVYRLIFKDVSEDEDWSERLWALECSLFESGMKAEEVFAVCRESSTNKFKRDKRPDSHLWADVLKAWRVVSSGLAQQRGDTATSKPLLTSEEIKEAEKPEDTFLDKYVEWASAATDAPKSYHIACGIVVLSTLLSGSIYLPTSFGPIFPNIWCMLLADTTITRKSTAMSLALRLLNTVTPDSVVFTDTTPEGMMAALSKRAGKSSLFWKDEVSGLFDKVRRKDYLSGLLEDMTYLYDGRYVKRVLSKTEVEVHDPRFVFLCAGIRTRVLSMLDEYYVHSGFLPRFLIVFGETTLADLRDLGPATSQIVKMENDLLQRLETLHMFYNKEIQITSRESTIANIPNTVPVEMTEACWSRFNIVSRKLLTRGIDSASPDIYTPMYDRMAKSILKVAMLLGAEEKCGSSKITIEEKHLIKALYYASPWLEALKILLSEVGKGDTEKGIEKVLHHIQKKPGTSRSNLMRTHHLTARDADMILGTLEQRGLIRKERSGLHVAYYPITLYEEGTNETM